MAKGRVTSTVDDTLPQQTAASSPPGNPDDVRAAADTDTPALRQPQPLIGTAIADDENSAPLTLPNTDWIGNRLTISGPAEAVRAFGAAARGTGGIPWQLDLDAEEARLLAPMAAAGPAARQLAGALRDAIAVRHDRVLAHWAQPGACPLDLHRLIPVPPAILQLGEDHPAARRWLWAHWGTTRPLHQVQLRAANADRRLRRSARMTIDFLSADWTPWAAIVRLRGDFPGLVFAIRPDYADG